MSLRGVLTAMIIGLMIAAFGLIGWNKFNKPVAETGYEDNVQVQIDTMNNVTLKVTADEKDQEVRSPFGIDKTSEGEKGKLRIAIENNNSYAVTIVVFLTEWQPLLKPGEKYDGPVRKEALTNIVTLPPKGWNTVMIEVPYKWHLRLTEWSGPKVP